MLLEQLPPTSDFATNQFSTLLTSWQFRVPKSSWSTQIHSILPHAGVPPVTACRALTRIFKHPQSLQRRAKSPIPPWPHSAPASEVGIFRSLKMCSIFAHSKGSIPSHPSGFMHTPLKLTEGSVVAHGTNCAATRRKPGKIGADQISIVCFTFLLFFVGYLGRGG